MSDDYMPYGITQNADAGLTTADALVGERVPWTTGNSVAGGPAFLSTAPYKPPRHERPQKTLGCAGKDGTCKVGPITGTDLCLFHTKQAQAEARRQGLSASEEVTHQPPVA